MIIIDGSEGEGGGQVLRTSLSMATVLGREVRIENIRAGRSASGLAAQHLTSVRAAAAICGAEVEGLNLGSERIIFRPGKIRGGSYRFNVGTAGAATLVLQTVLPALILAPTSSLVQIGGGTNVRWSPAQEYLTHVFLPAITEMGARVELDCLVPGFYPQGGGVIEARVTPLDGALRPLRWQSRGQLRSLRAISLVSNILPDHIIGRQIAGAREALGSAGLAVDRSHPCAASPGSMLMIAAGFERGRGGFAALGERGKPAEEVGREAGEHAAAFLSGRASVDAHLADQLLIYGAMAAEETGYRAENVTTHLLTNLSTIQQFLQVDASVDESSGSVRVAGAALRPHRRDNAAKR